MGEARVGDGGTGADGAADGGNALGNTRLGGDSGNTGAGNSGRGATPVKLERVERARVARLRMPDRGPARCRGRPPIQRDAGERERTSLIRDACQQLAEDVCLDTLRYIGPISGAAAPACSAADRALACEQDALLYLAKNVEQACEPQWRTLVACQIEANRAPGACTSVGALGSFGTELSLPTGIRGDERLFREPARNVHPSRRQPWHVHLSG